MAFDFDAIFSDALKAGVAAAKPGGKAAKDWIRESARANEESLRAIAEGVLHRQISGETGGMLLKESARALQSEKPGMQVATSHASSTHVPSARGRKQSPPPSSTFPSQS